jgi:hypothetical protein
MVRLTIFVYDNSSHNMLASINILVGIFEYEIDESRSSMAKVSE